MKGIQLEKETSLASNKSLADYNLSREHKFKQAKEQLARTYEQAIEIQKKFDEHKQKLRKFGLDSLTKAYFSHCILRPTA